VGGKGDKMFQIIIDEKVFDLEPEEMVEILAAIRRAKKGNEFFASAQAKAIVMLKEFSNWGWVY
jgi:hypothetical protein